MIHNFFLDGVVKKIQVSTPKDPKRNASAVLLIQYGPPRDSTGRAVEFVNAVLVRVPSYQWPRVAGKIAPEQRITVHGSIQGVHKTVMEEGHLGVELVADRIFIDGAPVRGEAPAAEAASSEAAQA